MQSRSHAIKLVLLLLMGVVVAAAAAPSPGPKPSSYAPAADLIAQVEYFVGRVEQATAAPADFAGANSSRTHKDANTLAALALVLSQHDENHKLKSSAGALLKASQQLAEAGENYEAAKKAFADVKQALAGQAETAAPGGWAKVASLPQLMKQVPLVHMTLKRSVTDPRRFKRDAAQAAGQAATLAAIAQASLFDTADLKQADVEKWYEYCAQMRDDAAEVNSAVRAGDQARATKALERMDVACHKCHETFR